MFILKTTTNNKMAGKDAKGTEDPSFFTNILDQIQKELTNLYGNSPTKVRSKYKGNVKLKQEDIPASFSIEIDNYWEFIQALPWKETWMICLMIFHIICFFLIMVTRKYHNTQYLFFFLLLVGVYCSESINELAAEHHKKFSKENYFDSNGLFISTVFAGPVLINCMILIGLWLTSAAQGLIDIKRQQIAKEKSRELKRNAEDKNNEDKIEDENNEKKTENKKDK